MLWTGVISYELRDNQGGPVLHLNLRQKDFKDEKIAWKLEVTFGWLKPVDGKPFINSNVNDGRTEYKVVFNNEYSFHGVAKQVKGNNEEKKDERLYLPLNQNEIIAFAKALFSLKILYSK
jgi:hypothetical protein